VSEFNKGDLVRVKTTVGRYGAQEGTVKEWDFTGWVLVEFNDGSQYFSPYDLEVFDPAPEPKVRVGRLKTGIVVLDDLDWEFENGTDEDYLKAVEQFCEVGERLPRGAFLSVKYARRLLAIAEQAKEV
jgi:hypothetical protein